MPKKIGRVLITGSRGFVGNAITPAIRETFDVIELDNKITDSDNKTTFAADISNINTLDEIFQKAGQIDFIIHLAADRNDDAP